MTDRAELVSDLLVQQPRDYQTRPAQDLCQAPLNFSMPEQYNRWLFMAANRVGKTVMVRHVRRKAGESILILGASGSIGRRVFALVHGNKSRVYWQRELGFAARFGIEQRRVDSELPEGGPQAT
jgi:hypothetical protein